MRFGGQMRSLFLVLIGILIIGGCFVGMLWLGHRAQRTEMAVVAVQTIPPLEPITSAEVKLEPVPAVEVHGARYVTASVVVGRFSQYGIYAGTVLQSGMLMTHTGGLSTLDVQLNTASKQEKQALEAVPLPLNQSAGFTLPVAGDHVTLLGVLQKPASAGSQQNAIQQAQVVIARGLVLSVLAPQSSPTPGVGIGGGSQPPAATQATSGVLVLGLTLQQAEKLALAESMGKVTLLLDKANGQPCGSTGCPTVTQQTLTQVPVKG